MPFAIAPATSDDLPQLEQLAHECGLAVDFVAELQRSYALLRVVYPAGERRTVQGFLLAWRAADELHLTDLGVTAAARRRGLARALVNELLREGRQRGSRLVLLEVRASNAAALALYGALGFEELDRRARYYADTGEDAVVMQLVLS
ncbi:MAG TPA: ribosomal protein S18-alanine N-acetyltransferase [Polyangiaceae bacterium]|nr:ribosomal protein S18-alanine N-acetyltransferase [Polyangiaceae bacterium]